MKKYVNGEYIEMTDEELSAMQAEAERAEAEYWQSVSYAEAVNAKIREQYSQSDEFGLLRQMLKKPDEFAKYFAFCEECKAFVKEQMAKYSK